MRYAFAQQLLKRAKNNKNIILLTGDLGFTVFEDFQKEVPYQFINMGVSEANMMGVAAGLALSGKIVFVYSIATFATMRPFEQIRNDICGHKAHVIIVGTGAGLSYPDQGLTHHSIQDIALMRALPNMKILCPADPVESHWAVDAAIRYKGPLYLRLGKKGEPTLYQNLTGINLRLGRGSILRKGGNVALVACGNIVANVMEAGNILEKRGFSATIISMHTIKPIDKKLIKDLAKRFPLIVTVEEHSVVGGLGSAIAEVLTELQDKNTRFHRLGIPDSFVEIAGSHKYLRELYNLTPEKIAQSVVHFLR